MKRVHLALLATGCAASPPPPPPAVPYAVLPPAPREGDPSVGRAASSVPEDPSRSPRERPMQIDLPTAMRLAGAESLALALARERAG